MAKNAMGKFVVFMLLLLIIFLVAVAGYYFIKNLANPGGNETQQNITQYVEHTEVTVVEPGKLGGWDFATITVITLATVAFLGFIVFMIFKFISGKKSFIDRDKEKCEKKAKEELIKKGWPIHNDAEARQSTRYFGGHDQNNKGWVFVFVSMIEQDPLRNIKTIDPSHLISCFVDTKTLDVFNERSGLDLDMIEDMENKRMFGKHDQPKWPHKSEKQPTSFSDLISNPTVNVGGQIENQGGE